MKHRTKDGPVLQTNEEWAKENIESVTRDGDAWFATPKGFVNLQESPAGFGPTIADAIYHLRQQYLNHADDFHHYEKPFIKIDFQEGPVKEAGVNGCQNEDVLKILIHRMNNLQAKFPCVENERTLDAYGDALMHLESRTKKRVAQGVEGENKPHVS